jgi:hypothetical protein
MMIRANSLKVVGPALAVALMSAPALASRMETAFIHASICQMQDTGGMSHALYTTAGVANDQKISNLRLVCPLPFGSFTATNIPGLGQSGSQCNGDAAARPWVDVYDRNSTKDVSCTLFISNDGGGSSGFTVTSSGSAGPVQRLFFNVVNLNLPVNARLSVICDVPVTDTDFSYVADFGIPICEFF